MISREKMYRLLQLLLGSDVGGVSAFLLTTIGGSGMKTSITFTANHFVGIVFLGQKSQGWFNDTTTKSQHQMKSRFCKLKKEFFFISLSISGTMVRLDRLEISIYGLDVVMGENMARPQVTINASSSNKYQTSQKLRNCPNSRYSKYFRYSRIVKFG